MANTAHLKGLFQSPRGFFLLGIFSLFFLFLSVQSQNTATLQNPWPGLQFDAQFSGHYPGSAQGFARPQNFLTYSATSPSPGTGHFTVAANTSGQYIYSAYKSINVYQIVGQTLNLTTTLPINQPRFEFDQANYLTTLQPFGSCKSRLAATMFLSGDNTTQQGEYLFYWCLDGGDNNYEFSTPTPFQFTTTPAAQVAADGSYELIAVGAIGNLVLFFTPLQGLPAISLVASDAITVAIDPSMNVYFASNSTLYAYSTTVGQTKSLIWSVPIEPRLCQDFMGSCFINLDSGKGVIYLYGFSSQSLYAFKTLDGSTIKNYTLGEFPRNYGALSNNSNANTLIIPTSKSILAINVQTWTTAWSYASAGNSFSNIITDELPYAYGVNQRGEMIAVNVSDGTVEWFIIVQKSSNTKGVPPSLSLGPGASLVPSYDDLIWMLEPAKAIIPRNYYSFYPMNVINAIDKTFEVSGNPQEDVNFDTISCMMTDSNGKIIPSIVSSQTQVKCYTKLPIIASSVDAYYTFEYTVGSPLNETYHLPTFRGVGVTSISPTNFVGGTSSRLIVVSGTGFSVCAVFGPCFCGFGGYDATNIANSPNVTRAYFVNDATLNCTSVDSSNPITSSTEPLPFSLIFPGDPNSGSVIPYVTANPGVQVTYIPRLVPPVTPPHNPPHKKHTAAIVVPIVVVLLVIVVAVGGFLYYRMRQKQQEYSPITGDRRSYTAF